MNYISFRGRANRKEYCLIALVYLVILFAPFYLMNDLLRSSMILGWIIGPIDLILFITLLATTVRRLHDTDRSGWWILIFLVPGVGQIVLLVFMFLPGTPGDNSFGPAFGTVTQPLVDSQQTF